jgi:EmrB/QacA subfamily drug resistance transporter
MEALDTTVINTAIPSMSLSLQVNPIDLKITLISYLLSLAIFIPISGWIADKFGIKRVFIYAVLIFSLSSFWCGLAHKLFELVIARALQGFGGALALPIGRLIILRTFSRSKMITAMSHVAIVASLGTMLGPVLGGFITHYFSWRWIFWINIPVGISTMILAHYWFVNEYPRQVHKLDKLGFILFGGSLAGFTFGASAFSESELAHSSALLVICISLVFLLAYIWHSRYKRHPIIKTGLLRIRTFRVSVLGNLLSRLGFGGIPFLVPLLLQIALGYPAQVSGMLLAPMALGIMFARPFTLKFLRSCGYKKLLIGNTLLVSLSTFSFIIINAHTSFYTICLLTFLFGFIISLQYSGMNSLAFSGVTSDDLSAATSINSTVQQLAQSFGVAMSAILLRYFSANEPAFSLTTTIFHHTFLVIGIISLLSTLIFIKLKKDDGHEMIDVRETP